MDDGRIDFSALDPKRDPKHFDQMVQAVMAGARSPAPALHALPLQLFRWGAVAVAIAAALAIVAWLPALTTSQSGSEAGIADAADPVELVSAWADRGSIPSDVDLFEVLGGDHVIR
jgi:hypothetical protein